jgi:hypothetical protein
MEAVSVSGAGVFQLLKVRKIPVCREQGDSRLNKGSQYGTGFLSKGYPYVAALIAACLFTIGCFGNSNSTRLNNNGSTGAITVTVAPSTTAPDPSSIVPEIAADACAHPDRGLAMTMSVEIKKLMNSSLVRRHHVVDLLLTWSSNGPR